MPIPEEYKKKGVKSLKEDVDFVVHPSAFVSRLPEAFLLERPETKRLPLVKNAACYACVYRKHDKMGTLLVSLTISSKMILQRA